jgi:hypothetical protein
MSADDNEIGGPSVCMFRNDLRNAAARGIDFDQMGIRRESGYNRGRSGLAEDVTAGLRHGVPDISRIRIPRRIPVCAELIHYMHKPQSTIQDFGESDGLMQSEL